MATLFVPLKCEALVVNDAVVRSPGGFRWWPFNYLAMNSFLSPEANALDGGTGRPRPGVYLHWTLPAALRRGVRRPGGGIEYPLVPNRWLVMRAGSSPARPMTGWIVESDCPCTSGDVSRSSQYLVDRSIAAMWASSGDPLRQAYTLPDGAAVANLGMAFPQQTWKERAASSMFLTAVAPGNALFAAYYPHHRNIFGFYDDLEGIDAGEFTYEIVGWYSDPSRDILAVEPSRYPSLMNELRWDVTSGDRTPATRSLYTCGVSSIPWHRKGSVPSPDALRPGIDIGVGVGNTAADAFGALVNAHVDDPARRTLLRACHYDLLHTLDDVNGPALLEQKIRQEWFGSIPGGYRWAIVEREAGGRSASVLTSGEQEWVARLNADQQALDDAIAMLASLQWRVHALWYKAGRLRTAAFPPQGAPSVDEIDALLDAAAPGTDAHQLVRQIAEVRRLMASVPRPLESAPPERALQAGIEAFAASKGLDAAKQLKAAGTGRYWRANNPVVIVSGVASPYDADPDARLDVELWNPPAQDAHPPAEAHAAFRGSGSSARDDAWSGQPWSPLMMEWRGKFLAIDPAPKGEAPWAFDGVDYRFTGAAAPVHERTVSGMSILSPHAQFVLASRIEKYLSTSPAAHGLGDAAAAIQSVHDLTFLAQELAGFNEALAMQDARAFRRADDADLPIDTVDSVPLLAGERFHGIRQGQFYFTDLILYDRFGRVLPVITGSGEAHYSHFPVQVDEPLRPRHSLAPTVASPIELAPRLLQHARLDMDFAGENPVGGWLLPDHLGGSLLVYAPDGTALGSVRLATGLDGVTRKAHWTPAPESALTRMEDLAVVSQPLADLLLAPSFAIEQNFTAFLAAIDAALWTIDGGGRADDNLSVLGGRPLALVRLRLSLELYGEPIRDHGWTAPLEPSAPPAYLDQPFAVRIGDDAARRDGTVGYYTGIDYSIFNSVAAPEAVPGQRYVRQIGPVRSGDNYLRLSFAPGNNSTLVTILMDPRAAVTVSTGIVPVKQIDIPAAFVEGPLSNIEISFPIGPIVSTPRSGGAVSLPKPFAHNGSWTWWEPASDGWSRHDIADATPEASMPPGTASLREGVMRLSIDLRKSR